jgi:CheY-like chemotaxis protein
MRGQGRQREQLCQQLQEADRRKDEFLATVAHELRNPLAAIRNALQIMRLANHNREALEQIYPVMERQVQQMVRLIDDLMDVSRVARNKLQLRKQRVELAQVVRHAVECCRPLIESAGHELTVALPAEPIPVEADEARLAQVFANLLDNAAKYTERGGRISLTVQRDSGDAVVRLKDTGIGIDADQLAHIFEIFAQVDASLERSRGGLGIGLTLVKRLTEMHGGTVEAFSEGQDKGSEFVVRLPIVAEPPAQQQPAATECERQPIANPCKVLIVDDSEDTSTSMRTLLHMMGHDTRTAHDGLEAVAVAESYRPDVMLLDISLPKLSGHEVAQRIRRQPWGQAMKLVALTGWAQEEDKRRSREAGFDLHLIKPVEPAELEELLRKLCSGLA